MGFLEIAVTLVVVAAVVFQTWLSIRVHRSHLFEHGQKVMQHGLIWLLPIFGAGLVFSVLHDEAKRDTPPTELRG